MPVSPHRALLRLEGFAVAVVILMTATQLLLLSFETDPLFSRSNIDDITSWIGDRPRAGVALLGGVALIGLGLTSLWSLVRSLGTDRRVIVTRRKAGWTKLDRVTLQAAIERRLESIDRRNDVSASITSRGRVDLALTTPDPTALGPVQELRDAVDRMCVERALPCRSGKIVADIPRRITTRRKLR